MNNPFKLIKYVSFAPSQIKSFNDPLILVDKQDNVTGSISKLDAHKAISIKEGLIHRAFSVFIFNQDNKLLLQQRSNDKFTFPLLWTNSCCSHPQNIQSEKDGEIGSQIAAKKRVMFELGLDFQNIELEFIFVQKILYSSMQDEIWGESELDHIYFVKTILPEIIPFNKDEIQQIKLLSIENLDQFIKNEQVTPWFKKIYDYKLTQWWTFLINNQIEKLQKQAKTIIEL